MVLSYGASSVTLPTPLDGYSVDVHMGLHTVRLASGEYRISDDGVGYDYRTCRCNIQTTSEITSDLSDLLRTQASGRGETLTLALGATATGFYPAGPDGGDVGTFTVRVLSYQSSGWKFNPKNQMDNEIEMLIVTQPAYSLPTARSDGTLVIGSVTGLRWPVEGFAPAAEYAYSNAVTRGGVPYVMDTGTAADRWVSEWNQIASDGKAAALVNYLTTTGRGQDCQITAPVNFHLFGVDQSGSNGSGIYTTNLIIGDEGGAVLTMTRTRWDEWNIPLKYWMQEQVLS